MSGPLPAGGLPSGAQAWIDAALAARGLAGRMPADAVRARPWSRLWRITTTGEPAWFKVNGGATRYEAALLQVLAGAAPAGAPRLLGVDTLRGWSLLADEGTVLRELGPADLDRWAEVLRGYAATQRAVEPAVARLLAAGVPSHRARDLPRLFDELLADDAAMRRGQTGGLDTETGQRLTALRPRLVDWCSELADSPVAETLQHDDLHSGNVLVDGAGRTTVVDWGDASVAPPFATLLVTLRSLADEAGLAGPDDPALLPIHDAYLAAWHDVADQHVLVRQAQLAVRTGCIGRALSWQRALADASDAERDTWGEAVPGWLQELL